MYVLLISDTHFPDRVTGISQLLRRMKEYEPELILHAGDLTDAEVMEELERIAPAVAVQGNMDEANGLELPVRKLFEIKGRKILLHHGRGVHPRGDLNTLVYMAEEAGADVIVTGHTHTPVFEKVGKITVINPGSPTVPRFSPKSFMVAEFGKIIEAKLIKL